MPMTPVLIMEQNTHQHVYFSKINTLKVFSFLNSHTVNITRYNQKLQNKTHNLFQPSIIYICSTYVEKCHIYVITCHCIVKWHTFCDRTWHKGTTTLAKQCIRFPYQIIMLPTVQKQMWTLCNYFVEVLICCVSHFIRRSQIVVSFMIPRRFFKWCKP